MYIFHNNPDIVGLVQLATVYRTSVYVLVILQMSEFVEYRRP